MKPLQLLHLLWVRRLVVLAVTGAVVTLVLITNLLLPRTYVATASVVVNARNVDPLTGQNVPGQASTAQIATQIDVITSRNVALKAVDALGLTENERFLGDGPRPQDPGVLREQLARRLLGGMKVTPSAQSSVIRIEYTHTDRELAATLANGIAEAYLQTNLELRLDPARRQSVWYDEQLEQLRAEVEQAQERLTRYQREHGIVSHQDRLDVENARLEELARQLTEAQQAKLAAGTRLTQMQAALDGGRIDEVPDILGNPLLQSMKADLVRAEGRLAEIGERFGANYPQYQSAAAEVRALEQKMRAEVDRVRGASEQALAIATRQENELQRAFEEQKARILAMQQNKDAASVLSTELENAQRAYDAALARASQVRMESRLDQMDVALLDPAVAPLFPSSPRTKLNLVLAAVFGAMLAAGIALGSEILSPRVRLARDLSASTGLAVLAEFPKEQPALRGPAPLQLPRPAPALQGG